MSTELAPLTRKEVEAWPPLGPMALKAQRVLELFDDLDEARATAELHAAALAQVRAELEQTRRELEHERRNAAQLLELNAAKTAELEGQVAYLADALWRDDVGMSKALGQIRAHIRGRAWVLEGRGPLEWNDDTYREEAGLAMRPCLEIAEAALSSSGDLLHPTLRDLKAKARAWVDGVRFEAFAQLGSAIVKAFEVKDSDMIILQGLELPPEHAHRVIEAVGKTIAKSGRRPIVVGLSPLEPISVEIMSPEQREHLRDELNRHMGLERLSRAELAELRSFRSELIEPTSTSGDNRLGELIDRLLGAPTTIAASVLEALKRIDEIACRTGPVGGIGEDPPEPINPDGAEIALTARDAVKLLEARDGGARCSATSNLGACVLEAGHAGQHAARISFGIDIGAPSSAPKKVLPECSSTEHAHCSLCGACERRPGEQCLCYAR